MYVHAAHDVALPQHLHLLHQRVVAFLLGLLL